MIVDKPIGIEGILTCVKEGGLGDLGKSIEQAAWHLELGKKKAAVRSFVNCRL